MFLFAKAQQRGVVSKTGKIQLEEVVNDLLPETISLILVGKESDTVVDGAFETFVLTLRTSTPFRNWVLQSLVHHSAPKREAKASGEKDEDVSSRISLTATRRRMQ